MKKLLLSLLMAVTTVLAGSAAQDAAVILASDATYSGSISADKITKTSTHTDITVTGVCTMTSSNGTYNNGFRFYAKSYLKFTPAEGVTLEKIVFTNTNSADVTLSLVDSSEGTLSYSNKVVTWTGTTQKTVSIKPSAQIRANYIEIYYSREDGQYTPNVTIADATGYVGEKVDVEVIKPSDLELIYTTENNDIISIDGNVITAVGLGTATVTASWKESEKYLKGSVDFTINVVEMPTTGKVTFDYTISRTASNDQISLTEAPITIVLAKAEGSNPPAYNKTDNGQTRLYAKGTITISAATGFYVKSMSMTTSTSNGSFLSGASADCGNFNASKKTWDCGDELPSSVTITNGTETSGHIRIKTITVEYGRILGSMAAPKAKYSAAKNELTLTAFDTNGNAVEGAEIRYAITADETAPEAYDIYDGAFSPDFEGVCYVWAYATAQGYVAGEPAIVRTITEGKSADFAPATELVDGNWYIIVAANGMHALGAENAEGHHDGVEVEVVDNKLVADQHSGIIEFQFKNGHLAVKEGMTGESGDNYLAPASAGAAKADMHKAIGAQPASTNVTFGDNAHEVTVDGQKLGYNAENGTFGFSEAHSEPVLLYTTADGTNTGVDEIAADSENAAIEYFNLQGVRVENPSNGLYIKRQGSKVSKVIIR